MLSRRSCTPTGCRSETPWNLDPGTSRNDIAALKVASARLRKGDTPGKAVTRDDMAELIADVHEHLADLGGD